MKQKGKEEKALVTANVLVATMFCFLGGSLFFLQMIFFPDYEGFNFIFDSLPTGSDKLNGKILGLLFLLIFFLIVRFTIGTKKSYEKSIAVFEQLPPEEQHRLARRGNVLFIGTVVLLLFSMFSGISMLD